MAKQNSKLSPPIQVNILRLSHDGRGIAQHQGKTLFVSGALPGEEATISILQRHTHYDEARALEITKPAANRQLPRCPHFGTCGGCSLQHMPYPFTVEHKLNTVLEVLSRQGKITPLRVGPTLIGSPYGYRRRARLAINYDRAQHHITLGFREKNSHRITPLSRCEIIDPWFGARLSVLTEQLNTLSDKQNLVEIMLIADNHEHAIAVHHRQTLSSDDRARLSAISSFFEAKLIILPEVSSPTELSYTLANHGLTFHYSAEQFIQVNAPMNQQLVDAAVELLAPEATDQILDLFCGVGNFSLPIAQLAANVVGVEGDATAIAYATANAARNGIRNTQFHVQNLFLPSYQGVWNQQRYAKLLIDPPRAGAKEAIARVGTWKPQCVVYVSCNPFTLARDAALLATQGYQLVRVQLADMFPQTEHCEVIAQFKR